MTKPVRCFRGKCVFTSPPPPHPPPPHTHSTTPLMPTLLQLDIDEFRLMLAACEAPITEEEFCMLVDKYDVNEDRFISDTELLSHVRGCVARVWMYGPPASYRHVEETDAFVNRY